MADDSNVAKDFSAERHLNVFQRIILFIQEVIAELKKVVWPTGEEVRVYTIVVLVFVTVMMFLITGLNFVVGSGTTWLFG